MSAPAGAPDLTVHRREIVAAARHLAGRGLSPGSSGNLSVRVGDVLVVTPTGSSLSRVDEVELAVVPLQAGQRVPDEPSDRPRPSKEVPLHRACYGARPQARAVVHLHSPFATAAACLPPDQDGNAPLPPLTPYQVLRLAQVPVAPYARPGTQELAEGVRRLAPTHAAILLANHGCVVTGPSIAVAVDLAEELETAAHLFFLLRGAEHRPLTAAQVEQLRTGP